MSIEAMKQAYHLLLTEPHTPTVCDQLEIILRQAIQEEALRNVQRLGQEIEAEAEKQVSYSGNGTAGRENMTAPTGFLFQMPKADHFPDATKMIEPKREPLVFGLSDDGQFTFSVGVQTFTLDYFPENDEEIEFMKKQLTHAIEAAHGIKEKNT